MATNLEIRLEGDLNDLTENEQNLVKEAAEKLKGEGAPQG